MAEVVLGLGSNSVNKLCYLRLAVNRLIQLLGNQNFCISSIYRSKALLPDNAPKSWDKEFFNLACKAKTFLAPFELLFLLKRIELELGRDPEHLIWSPRVIDIDILAYDNVVIRTPTLTIPHEHLMNRRFALEPLLEIWPTWKHPILNVNLHRYIVSLPSIEITSFKISGTKIVAIVNLSSDSFSENMHMENLLLFEKTVIRMVKEGAEVIDLGAESTKPNANRKTPLQNFKILEVYLNVLEDLFKRQILPISIGVSIDTYHYEVVKKVLRFDCVSIINDVYGVDQNRIIPLLRGTSVKYLYMHKLGVPGYKYFSLTDDCVKKVIDYCHDELNILLKLGMNLDQIIFDPGIGFSKYPFQAKNLISRIDYIKQNIPVSILVGHSRKLSVTPLVKSLNLLQRDVATAIITAYLIKENVDYVRVHNVMFSSLAKLISS